MYGVLVSSFPAVSSWERWDILHKDESLDEAFLVIAFSCSSRSWPCNKARRMLTHVIPRVYDCCFLENNSILWKHLRGYWAWGQDQATASAVMLHAHPTSNEAAFSCDRFGPRWERCTLSGIREIAEGEACSPTVNNCQSQASTGSVSYFDVRSVESGWYVGVLKWESLSWELIVEVMFGVQLWRTGSLIEEWHSTSQVTVH